MTHELPLQPSDTHKLLGQEVVTTYNMGGKVLEGRGDSAVEAAQKIAILRPPVPVSQKLVQTIVIPRLLYGIAMQPPKKKVLAQIKSCILQAEQLNGRAHSWEVLNAIVLSGHRHDPKSAAKYRTVLEVLRALRADGDTRQAWEQLSQETLRPKPQGPRRTYLQALEQLGIREGDIWNLQHDQLGTLRVLEAEWREIKTYLIQAVRRVLISEAEQRRRRFGGLTSTDTEVTARIFRQKWIPHRHEVIAVVCDALWTERRKYVAGKAESDECPWCPGEVENPEHVFYRCPQWETDRVLLRQYAGELEGASVSTRQCGHAPAGLSEVMKNDWSRIQLEMGRIWSQRMMAKKRKDDKSQHHLEEGECSPPNAVPSQPSFKPLEFRIPSQISEGYRPWQYGQTAWLQILRLLMYVREPEVIRGGKVATTVLELYLQYVLLYGTPFLDGHDHDTKEGWLGTQLASFTSALKSAQERLGLVLVQAGKSAKQRKAEWGARFGFPPLPLLQRELHLPDGGEIWGMIERAPIEAMEACEASAPKHAGMWRRWRPAKGIIPKHPQVNGTWGEFELGHLNTHNPAWADQIRKDQKWIARLETHLGDVCMPWGGRVVEYVRVGGF